MPLLEFIDLTIEANHTTIIDHFSLTIDLSYLHGILGVNGSGKTTLLKAIKRVITPKSGKITFDGIDISALSIKEMSQLIAIVPQITSIPFDFTVKEIVKMGCFAHHYSFDVEERVIVEALEKVGSIHLINREFSRLSGGERQLVYIARALASQASLILFDEPLNFLDVFHQIKIFNLIKQLKAEGKGIIVTLHDLLKAHESCEKISIIEKGKLIRSGDSDIILDPSLLDSVFKVKLTPDRRLVAV